MAIRERGKTARLFIEGAPVRRTAGIVAMLLFLLLPVAALADDYSGEYSGSGTLCEPLNGGTCTSILGDITVGSDGTFDAHGLSGSVDSTGAVTGSYDDGSGNIFPVTGTVAGNTMLLHAQKGNAYADWTLTKGGSLSYLGQFLKAAVLTGVLLLLLGGGVSLLFQPYRRAALARPATTRKAKFVTGQCPPRPATAFGLPDSTQRISEPGWRVKQSDGQWRSIGSQRERLRDTDTKLVRWHAGDDYYYAEPDATGKLVAKSVPFKAPAAGRVELVKNSAWHTVNLFVLGPDGKPGKIAFQFLHASDIDASLNGKTVEAGTVLGHTGNTSTPDEPVRIHLHVQARDFSKRNPDDQLIDPDCVYPRATIPEAPVAAGPSAQQDYRQS